MRHTVSILAATHSPIRQYKPVQKEILRKENNEGINYIWVKTPKNQGNGIVCIKNISCIYYGVLFILTFAFISSYFLTTLLTHSVLLFIFVAFLVLKNTAIEN